MAGERYAKITVQVVLSHHDTVRGAETAHWTFTLGSQVLDVYRGGQPGQFVVPSPTDVGVGEQYAIQAVSNALQLVSSRIFALGLPYVVSPAVQVGTTDTYSSYGDSSPQAPVIEFSLTATAYGTDKSLDFDAHFTDGLFPNAWKITSHVYNASPVTATAVVTDATYFGAANGAITVTGAGGYDRYLYAWDNGTYGAVRTGLVAGTYTCVVSEPTGAVSTTLTLTVKSDPELKVAVATTADSITLTVSGGLAPYAYAWDDGPTTAARAGLAAGTYGCLVTDARGVSKRSEVTLSAYQFYWSRNAIPLALDAGDAYRADPTTKPNLSFLCEVWLEPDYLSGKFTQVGPTLEQPADALGRTTFEVQALLDAYLDYHVPTPGQADVTRATPLFRRFFLRHAQQYGTVPTAQASISLERNYVAKGGLSFYERQARTWFTDYQPRVRPFLTWEPTTKPVLADQPEFLYYLVLGNPGSFRRRVRVTLSDGSQVEQELSGAGGVRDFEVYCLPVSYQALGLADLATGGLRVVQWQVWVAPVGGGPALSETRTYQLDARRYPTRRYLLFATSLGGMATYAALGQAQQDAEVTGEETALALPVGYDPQQGDVAVQARALRPVLKLAAGPRTPAQLVASQDLLLARRVLLLGPGRWVPGFVKAKTSTLLDESKLVPVQELEFVLATEQLYTPAL